MVLQNVARTDCDGADFAQLMRQHERQVLRTALRLTGNLEDAEDVAQDAFLKLHQELCRSAAPIEVGRWLYRVTVNLCWDLGRRKKRWRTPEQVDERVLASTARTPEGNAIDVEQHALVDRALRHLSERERAALVLREMEGLTTAEVAEVLGSSEATVRVQIAAARVKLRKLVGFLRETKT